MTDAAPLLPILAAPPRRDRQIVATAAASVLLHLLLLAWILLPRVPQREPVDPPAITVELVRPSAVSSEPPLSSEPPSSLPPVSSEAAASSAEPPSSAEPSSAASSEASASSAASEPPSSASASAPPVPPARPVVIPVGETSSEAASASEASSASEMSEASSAETSSAASEAGSSVLATNSPDAEGDPEAAAEQGIPPPPGGALHAAKHFYLEAMLDAPALAKARKALKTLPPDKRLAQTCNIEAIAQLGNAGKSYNPDALVASAFAAPRIAGTTYSVPNGAFRSTQKWVGVAYTCTLSKDMSAVTAFSFHLGADVTAAMEARFGSGQKSD